MRKVGRIDLIDPQGNIEDSKIITKFPYSSEIKFKKVGTYTFKLYDDEGNEIKGCYKMISRSLPVPTGHRHRVSYTLNNDENMRHCLAR